MSYPNVLGLGGYFFYLHAIKKVSDLCYFENLRSVCFSLLIFKKIKFTAAIFSHTFWKDYYSNTKLPYFKGV